LPVLAEAVLIASTEKAVWQAATEAAQSGATPVKARNADIASISAAKKKMSVLAATPAAKLPTKKGRTAKSVPTPSTSDGGEEYGDDEEHDI